MKRGTVVEDNQGKFWLCVREGDHPVSPDINALMHCEDQRVQGAVRWLKNLTVKRIVSVPADSEPEIASAEPARIELDEELLVNERVVLAEALHYGSNEYAGLPPGLAGNVHFDEGDRAQIAFIPWGLFSVPKSMLFRDRRNPS